MRPIPCAWSAVRACLAAAAAMLAAAGAAGEEFKPARNVDIVVASGAGGSSDRTARVIQKLLQASGLFPAISVTNRPGGGGAAAWTWLAQYTGDPHFIATFSPTMITNRLLGVGRTSHLDFTPLSIVLREYVLLTVSADSPIVSARDLLERIRKDPAGLSFAFASSPGNHNHVVIGMIFRAAGADPRRAKVVIQKSGGAGASAILGGHVDVLASAPAHALPHIHSGKARALGLSAAQRQPGTTAAIPTLKEQGIHAEFYGWRGFVGAKGLAPAQIAFWDQAFAKAIDNDEWRQALQRNAWAEDLKNAAQTRQHLDREHALLARMLGELGVIPERR